MLETNDVSYIENDTENFYQALKESYKPLNIPNSTLSKPEDVVMGVYDGIMCW